LCSLETICKNFRHRSPVLNALFLAQQLSPLAVASTGGETVRRGRHHRSCSMHDRRADTHHSTRQVINCAQCTFPRSLCSPALCRPPACKDRECRRTSKYRWANFDGSRVRSVVGPRELGGAADVGRCRDPGSSIDGRIYVEGRWRERRRLESIGLCSVR